MKTLIRNGRILDPANQLDAIADILIENNKVAHIGPQAENHKANRIIDAKDKWVIPGLIDSNCRPHLQHPHGSTLIDEAKAAIKCGFTALCIPPDGDLIIDTPTNVARFKQQTDEKLPMLFPIGALTKQLAGESMTDMSGLANSGCIALSQAMHPVKDLAILRHCYDYAASFNLLIIIQPQEHSLARGGIIHEGTMSTHLGLQGIPVAAETIAIAQHLQLIKETGIKAHFTCLSSSDAVQQIRLAKAAGLNVSADCAMHALHLTEMDIAEFNANCHVYPPLRSTIDRDGLIAGIIDGTIDAICSDHRPLDSIAKLAPFGDTVPGLSSIDTFFALGLDLVEKYKLEPTALIKAITANPAMIFNLPIGNLSIGAHANLCIVDPSSQFQVTQGTLYSSGKNSPFLGRQLKGQIMMTLLDGCIVHEA